MSKNTRIYKVKTPTGDRLVEAPTKGQAVKHCVDADYIAEVISASEALRMTAAGTRVEVVNMKDEPVKKPVKAAPKSSLPSESPAPVSASAVQSVSAPAGGTALPPASTPAAPSAHPQPVQPSAPTAPPSGVTAPPQGQVQAGSFIPPQPVQAGSGVSSNPVLAEQQRINPDAAAAAGAPGGPVDWGAREKATGN